MPDGVRLTDYDRVERAIAYLDAHFHEQPSLGELAAALGMSPFHLQRMFRQWAGISPKRFLQILTAQYVKSRLLGEGEVLPVAFDAGLSSSSRLHELLVNVDGITPGEFRLRGNGMTIRYGVHATPFGRAMIAITQRGICGLAFLEESSVDGALESVRSSWPDARFAEDPLATAPVVAAVFRTARRSPAIALHVRGTNFQIKVWQALLQLPPETFVSYEHVARAIGMSGARRAVASAIGRNPVAVIIPCHRVIRKTGAWGEYRWGPLRKRAVCVWEDAQLNGA